MSRSCNRPSMNASTSMSCSASTKNMKNPLKLLLEEYPSTFIKERMPDGIELAWNWPLPALLTNRNRCPRNLVSADPGAPDASIGLKVHVRSVEFLDRTIRINGYSALILRAAVIGGRPMRGIGTPLSCNAGFSVSSGITDSMAFRHRVMSRPDCIDIADTGVPDVSLSSPFLPTVPVVRTTSDLGLWPNRVVL